MKKEEKIRERERKIIRNEQAFFLPNPPELEELKKRKKKLPSISISFHVIRKKGFALCVFFFR